MRFMTSKALILLVGAMAAVPQSLHAQAAARLAEGRRLGQEAVAAYREGDLARFEAKTDSALTARPGHPGLLYNLAAARALAADTVRAVALLRRLAGWGVSYDPGADGDFDALHGAEAFEAARRRLLGNAGRRGTARRAFRLSDPEMLPEALAHDPATGSFLLGSVRRRSVTRIGPDGASRLFIDGRASGMPAPLGMVVDARRRALWIGGSSMAESESGADAASQVREYDLDTGALRRTIDLPAGMMAGDVALDSAGGVLVSDWRSGALLRIPAGAEAATILLPPGSLGSPQGIVVDAEREGAWVADYSLGLVYVDLASGASQIVEAPTTLLGSDALLRYGEDLIVVQNGVAPARVLRLSVSTGDGPRVESAEPLLVAHPDFAEPTGATIVGDALHLVANGQWSRFAGGEIRDSGSLARPVVLEVALDANLLGAPASAAHPSR